MLRFLCYTALFIAACTAQGADQGEAAKNSICKQRNSYVKVEGDCDSYIECREYRPTKMMCPDGLHYDLSTKWPAYPCGYPVDVPCLGRGVSQPARPTADCPNRYGYFPSPTASEVDCGQYRMCVDGVAMTMICPAGLAFNPAKSRCDWPDVVPTCNAEAFLGFKCPATPLGDDGEPLDGTFNYKYEGNCYYFFSCEHGHPRMLSCDEGFAFDSVSGRCMDADLVKCDEAVPYARTARI